MSSCFHQKPSTFTTHQSCQGSKAPANGLMGKFCQYLLQGACSMLGLQALNTPYLRFVAWGTMVQSSERENSPPSGLQGSHCWCPGWKEEEEAQIDYSKVIFPSQIARTSKQSGKKILKRNEKEQHVCSLGGFGGDEAACTQCRCGGRPGNNSIENPNYSIL